MQKHLPGTKGCHFDVRNRIFCYYVFAIVNGEYYPLESKAAKQARELVFARILSESVLLSNKKNHEHLMHLGTNSG